jgi:polysaccharide biosynthesis PFTS motif protein
MNLYYDIEYHWSKCSIEMSKSNDSKSKEFLITGPIWSSREFLNKKNHNIINIEKNLKNICLFNSSFPGYNAVNSIASHRNFLLLALEIIKTYPNFNIIFKSKNDFNLYATHEKTRELHKKLLDMKNIKIAEKGSFSPLIIQNTDLAISMSFASTGLEAMCLGVRSFYVDLTNTFKNSYFDNFDNLVSHSNVEALNNIEYWINISKENILLKYSQLFSSLGIEEGNRSTEIIRNRIIENSKKYLN